MKLFPNSQLLLNKSILLFGLCVQPFAEIPYYENKIPKVETNDVIFRCKMSNSYINNKYRITYNSIYKQVIVCNLCNSENDFDMSKPGMKNEYFNNDSNSVPELNLPTIDFIAPIKFQTGSTNFKPHYMFMIDVEKSQLLLCKNYTYITSEEWKWIRKHVQMVRNPEIFDVGNIRKRKGSVANVFFDNTKGSPIINERRFSYNIQNIFMTFILN